MFRVNNVDIAAPDCHYLSNLPGKTGISPKGNKRERGLPVLAFPFSFSSHRKMGLDDLDIRICIHARGAFS